ncbi:MAG: hypothetical protein ACOYMA_01410 [Bacteroidia bacterium]
MKTVNIITRIVFGIFFLVIGAFHFYAYQTMAVYVPLPIGSKAFVLLVGAIICISGIGIVINKYARLGLIIIAISLAFTGLLVLTPMILRNPDELMKMLELPNLYKLFLAFGIFTYLVSSKSNRKNQS